MYVIYNRPMSRLTFKLQRYGMHRIIMLINDRCTKCTIGLRIYNLINKTHFRRIPVRLSLNHAESFRILWMRSTYVQRSLWPQGIHIYIVWETLRLQSVRVCIKRCKSRTPNNIYHPNLYFVLYVSKGLIWFLQLIFWITLSQITSSIR